MTTVLGSILTFHIIYKKIQNKHWDDWTEEDLKLKGGWKNWRYYEDWWQAEGRSSFEQYLETRDNKQTDSE